MVRHYGADCLRPGFFRCGQLLWNASDCRHIGYGRYWSITAKFLRGIQGVVYCFCNSILDLWILSSLFQRPKKLLCIVKSRCKGEKEIRPAKNIPVGRDNSYLIGPVHGDSGKYECRYFRLLPVSSFNLMCLRMQHGKFGLLFLFRQSKGCRRVLYVTAGNDTGRLLW